MHREMTEHKDTFGEQPPSSQPCRKCKGQDVFFWVWESHDAGYEDAQFECRTFQHALVTMIPEIVPPQPNTKERCR